MPPLPIVPLIHRRPPANVCVPINTAPSKTSASAGDCPVGGCGSRDQSRRPGADELCAVAHSKVAEDVNACAARRLESTSIRERRVETNDAGLHVESARVRNSNRHAQLRWKLRDSCAAAFAQNSCIVEDARRGPGRTTRSASVCTSKTAPALFVIAEPGMRIVPVSFHRSVPKLSRILVWRVLSAVPKSVDVEPAARTIVPPDSLPPDQSKAWSTVSLTAAGPMKVKLPALCWNTPTEVDVDKLIVLSVSRLAVSPAPGTPSGHSSQV